MQPGPRVELSNLRMINRLAGTRADLIRRLEAIEGLSDLRDQISVIVAGERLGVDALELIQPIIISEMKARLAQLDRDLEAFGVQVG